MENKLNSTEQEFRKVAQNYTPSIATDDIWNTIESKVPKKAKRRYFGMYWFLFGAATAGIIAFGAISLSNERQDVALQDQPSERQYVEISDIKGNNPNEVISKINTRNKNENNVIFKTNIYNKGINSSLVGSDLEIRNNRSDNTTNQSYYHNTPLNKPINNYRSSLYSQEKVITTKPVNTDKFSKQIADRSVENNNTEVLQKVNPIGTAEDQSRSIQISSVNLVELGLFHIQKHQINLLVTPYNSTITPYTPRTWQWEYGFHSGVNISSERYTTATKEAIDLDQRFGLEKGLPGISIDLRAGQRSTRGYSWYLGLGYSLVANQFERKERIVNTYMEPGVTEIRIDDSGVQVPNIDQLLISEIDDVDIRWNRMRQTFSISLGVSIPLAQFNKWVIDAEAGLRYDLYSNTAGYYFEPNQSSITKFERGESNPYRKSGSSQIQLGIPISYSLSKVELVLTPYYRYGMNNITNRNSFYNQRSSQSGLQLGIVYRPQ